MTSQLLDGVHPNDTAHELIAKELSPKLIFVYKQSFEVHFKSYYIDY